MYFQIGVVELMMALALLLAGWAVSTRWAAAKPWSAAVPAAVLAASMVTPADPFSTVIVASVCLAFFAAGAVLHAAHVAPQSIER